MKENDIFLSVKGLNVVYHADGKVVHAVNGVSFDLKRGQTIGLVGETGAGKTTIAKAILGILPELNSKVTAGEIWLDGENLLTLPEKKMLKVRGHKIAMVFQDPMTALNPVMRVGSQIAEAIRLHNEISKKEAMERAEKMLEMVGIPAARYREYPHQFSGGMKQRVVIAMALACNPELLLADEPTTALDVTIQAQVLEMMSDLKKKQNTSMVMITHDLGIVAEVCDTVAVIYAGQLVEYGEKEAVFDRPCHPYTQGLFGAVPSISDGDEIPVRGGSEENEERLKPIEGLPPDPTDLPAGCHFSPRCPYAGERCRTSEPEMAEAETGHFCRCFQALHTGG